LANLVLLGNKKSKESHFSAADGSGSPSGRTTPIPEEHDILQTEEMAKRVFAMKPALIDAIQEVINELETVYENVAKNAREYIHSECVSIDFHFSLSRSSPTSQGYCFNYGEVKNCRGIPEISSTRSKIFSHRCRDSTIVCVPNCKSKLSQRHHLNPPALQAILVERWRLLFPPLKFLLSLSPTPHFSL
jgi:hypothetical protein